MDQSKSMLLPDQDDKLWAAKLAMLGYQLSTFESFYFLHDGEGHIKVCGQDLPSLVKDIIEKLTKERTR
jgi:hypothetical protein